jgi:uncharacterized protein YqhQ
LENKNKNKNNIKKQKHEGKDKEEEEEEDETEEESTRMHKQLTVGVIAMDVHGRVRTSSILILFKAFIRHIVGLFGELTNPLLNNLLEHIIKLNYSCMLHHISMSLRLELHRH